MAAGREDHGAVSQPSRLALDSTKGSAVVGDEVIPGVLSEGHQDSESGSSQGEDDRDRRVVADVLWMLHSASVPAASGQAVS
jgi:hypothetical protein